MKTKLIMVIAFSILALALGLCSGSQGFSVDFLISALKGHGIDSEIFFDLRFPRVLAGFFVGGSLAVSGSLLQALFKNPLVEPYTLGISGGAAVGTVVGMFVGLSKGLGLPGSGFLGALFTMGLVYFLSLKGMKLILNRMLLIGVMVSFVSSSLVLFVEAIVSPNELRSMIYWLMGTLQWIPKTGLTVIIFSSLFVALISFIFSVQLNAISIGEEDAKGLGVDVELIKTVSFVLASLACGVSVAFVGIIGFVGLVIPHFFRIIMSRDYRVLIPLSFFGGGSFLVLSDALARLIIAPAELPVGVITGIIGGLTFIWVLINSSGDGLW